MNPISLKEHPLAGELAFTLAFAASIAVDNRRRLRRIALVGGATLRHGKARNAL